MSTNQTHLNSLPGESKKEKVRNMFNSIAGNYDFLNHFLSFGVDFYWRNQVLKIIKDKNPETILDIATGTGDLAILASKAKPKKIMGIDISEEMLNVGIAKVKDKNLNNIIELQQADSENLPFNDNEFDLAMVAFGVRNFENLEKGLSEIRRVLKPKGTLIILEFSQPKYFPVKQLYSFYSKYILPLLGRIISKDANAYTYLPESVKRFPCYNELCEIMSQVGYNNTNWKALSGGISSIYTGIK